MELDTDDSSKWLARRKYERGRFGLVGRGHTLRREAKRQPYQHGLVQVDIPILVLVLKKSMQALHLKPAVRTAIPVSSSYKNTHQRGPRPEPKLRKNQIA